MQRLQLEAQLHYRLGDNKQAIRVYQELYQKHKVGLQSIMQHRLDLCICWHPAATLKCCSSRHQAYGGTQLVMEVDTRVVLWVQVQSLELHTNVLAAYVCGGHADEVRWMFMWLAQPMPYRHCH